MSHRAESPSASSFFSLIFHRGARSWVSQICCRGLARLALLFFRYIFLFRFFHQQHGSRFVLFCYLFPTPPLQSNVLVGTHGKIPPTPCRPADVYSAESIVTEINLNALREGPTRVGWDGYRPETVTDKLDELCGGKVEIVSCRGVRQ